MVTGVTLTVSLVLFALNKNINLYYTPSQLTTQSYSLAHLRLGGLVKKQSIKRKTDSLTVAFTITDLSKDIPVQYSGILPSLFREGQGVVVEGRFKNGLFQANQVLAKHDEKYMPPGLKSTSRIKNDS